MICEIKHAFIIVEILLWFVASVSIPYKYNLYEYHRISRQNNTHPRTILRNGYLQN